MKDAVVVREGGEGPQATGPPQRGGELWGRRPFALGLV